MFNKVPLSVSNNGGFVISYYIINYYYLKFITSIQAHYNSSTLDMR